MSTPTTRPKHGARRRGKQGRADARAQRNLAAFDRVARREENLAEQARRQRAARQWREENERGTRGRAARRKAELERRNDPRRRLQERMLDLLRRGCGVTQILAEFARPRDRIDDRIEHAETLRRALHAVRDGAPHTASVCMKPRDLERTLRYLDWGIDLLRQRRSVLVRTEPGGDSWTLFPAAIRG